MAKLSSNFSHICDLLHLKVLKLWRYLGDILTLLQTGDFSRVQSHHKLVCPKEPVIVPWLKMGVTQRIFSGIWGYSLVENCFLKLRKKLKFIFLLLCNGSTFCIYISYLDISLRSPNWGMPYHDLRQNTASVFGDTPGLYEVGYMILVWFFTVIHFLQRWLETYIPKSVHVYVYIHVYTCLCICMYTCIHAHVYTCMGIMYINICMCVHMYMCRYVYMYINVCDYECMCMYVHIFNGTNISKTWHSNIFYSSFFYSTIVTHNLNSWPIMSCQGAHSTGLSWTSLTHG